MNQLDLVKAEITSVGTIESNIAVIKNQALEIKKYYEKLAITEKMLDQVKVEKANVNKAKSQVADYRKQIIAEFKKPIDLFEKTAKETEKILSETYDCINEQVQKYENETKRLKAEEVKAYFDDYAQSLKIDFVNFEQANINITLSASVKSLKESAKEFIDKIVKDLQLIDTQENKVEILTEYKRTLNVSDSILTVKTRIEAEKAEREKQEILAKAKLEQQAQVKKVEEATAPKEVVEEKTYSMIFKVVGTLDQLKDVKNFLLERGIKYEQCE